VEGAFRSLPDYRHKALTDAAYQHLTGSRVLSAGAYALGW
jgi:hypothetical protein